MSFRLKTILGIALIEILLLSLLVYSSMDYLKSSNEEQLYNRANTSAQLLATMSADSVVAMDLATLDELLEKTITNRDIIYIRVSHIDGFVLSQKGNKNALQIEFEKDKSIQEVGPNQIFDVSYPIEVAGEKFGNIELGISTKSLELLFENATNRMLSVALIEIVLVGVFGYALGGMLTRQLTSLQVGARKVAEGNLGHTISVRGKDELADTATSFNEMSRALHKYADELQAAKKRADTKRLIAESILDTAVQSLSQGVMIVDQYNNIQLINNAFLNLYDIPIEEQDGLVLDKDIRKRLGFETEDNLVCNPVVAEMEMPVTKLENGKHIMHSYKPLSLGGGVWVDTDITQIMEAEEKNRKLEHDLLQSQQMESIGTLAGGIAHEINTPIQYIGDNLKFMGEAVSDLMEVISKYDLLNSEIRSKNIELDTTAACEKAIDEADLEFLRDELPSAVSQSIQGVMQVSNIVLAMKEFAHPSSKEMTSVDLNRVVERSIAICKNEWKVVADLDLKLNPELPMITGLEGELNQIVLNLVVNAAQAISEKSSNTGRIDVSTERTEHSVKLIIQDNGAGIPDDIKNRIFDPFFTTKEVGKGTGQGLAICRDIVVNKHNGSIDVDSVINEGTKFTVSFPLV